MLRFGGRRLLQGLDAAASPSVQLAIKGRTDRLDGMSPRKIADVLNQYIVGQEEGKKAVAISLRNRWRRRQLTDLDLQSEVMPKNILLIGPTGVGKTEISRRMAKITDAPFVKVEATKYTEVGFKGKDVESIIEDLYTNAKAKAKKFLEEEREAEARMMALEIVFSAWQVGHRSAAVERAAHGSSPVTEANVGEDHPSADDAAGAPTRKTSKKPRKIAAAEEPTPPADVTREYFMEHYNDEFKNDMVTITLSAPQALQKPTSPGGIDLQSVGALLGFVNEPKKVITRVMKKVVDAVPLAMREALDKLIDESAVNTLARTLAEQEGIVFIDEIDKVVAESNSPNEDVSSTGVQQDLLPLVEGSNVTMKDGAVIATDSILFICSGAFHVVKTSDMIAELQGRLPVRVELKPLTEADFRRILTEPVFNLLQQQKALLATEGIQVEFTEDGISELARTTCSINAQTQNIGARRLHTIIERVMDPYSFACEEYAGKTVVVDAEVVRKATETMQKSVDIAKYLL